MWPPPSSSHSPPDSILSVPPGPLGTFCANYLNFRNPRDLDHMQQHSQNFSRLRTYIRGIKVVVDLHKGSRPKGIRDLVHSVGSKTFPRGDQTVTVAVRVSICSSLLHLSLCFTQRHFKDIYGIAISPMALGIKVGNEELLPISVCKTVAQLYKVR